jgi:MFS family permease
VRAPAKNVRVDGMTRPQRLMNRNFVLLWQGQFVSQLGSQAFAIAMMFWLKHATGSASMMGMVMMASMLPMVVLAPIGGTVADRFSRRRIIIASDLISGVGVVSFAAAMFLRPDATAFLVTWLFVVALAGGVVRAFFTPAISAAIPSIVPPQRVASANSLNEGSSQVSMLIGQALGGLLFRLLGAPVLFLIDGITYLVSAVSEMFIEIPQALLEEGMRWREAGRKVFSDLRDGLAHIRSQRGMPDLMAGAAVFNFFAMPFFVLLPFFVEDELGATPDWFGYLLAGMGAGGILGYVLAGSLRVSGHLRSALMIACLVGMALGMGAFGLVQSATAALALMLGVGVFQGFFQVGAITLLQLSTPESLRGRVFGVLHTLVMGLSPISMGLAGVVADLVDHDVRLIFVVCGAVMLATAAAAVLDRRLRDYLAWESQREGSDGPARFARL